MENELLVTTQDGVRVLTLNRPERFNAINDYLSTQLEVEITKASTDDEVRVIVITGNGKGFCTGLDLIDRDPSKKKSRFERLDDLTWIQRLILSIVHNDKPVIAAINGVAGGGGFGITLACDFRFMAANTRMTSGYIRNGMSPDAGVTYFLPRLIGHGKATELILTGRFIYAEEAKQIGLVNDIYPEEELKEQVFNFAKQLAEGPPIAMTYSKRLLVTSSDLDLTTLLKQEISSIKVCFQSEDLKEGIRAFSEKRKPVYKGE